MAKIISVTVTRDRLPELKKVIESLRNSEQKPDEMIVVNNDSQDGTREWLDGQSDLIVINQGNTGSSGGEYSGMKLAMERGADFVWLVEDDIIPRPDCLAKLAAEADENTVAMPFLYHPDGREYFHTAISYNLSNPFRSFWREMIGHEHLSRNKVRAVGITFEGPLIHRNIIDRVGFPDTRFFVYADDTDYFIRADRAGFGIDVITAANCDRLFSLPPDGAFTWKHYYLIRNIIAVNVMHGNLAVRILRPLAYLALWAKRAKSFENLKTVIRAFRDGYFFKKLN